MILPFYFFTFLLFFLIFAAAKLIKKLDMTNDRWTNLVLGVVALLLAALCVASIISS
jgi:Mn2+/Fe2+ NRAMP family transporter